MGEYIWLVVWNMAFMTFHSVGKNNPNWRTPSFFREGSKHNQIMIAMAYYSPLQDDSRAMVGPSTFDFPSLVGEDWRSVGKIFL